jgi:glucose/arabinose dehydrogenase
VYERKISYRIRQPVPVWLLVLWLFAMTNLASAQTFSAPGFTAETVVTLPPYQAVGVTFAPDGRLFVWQKNGQVRIVKNGALLSQPFFTLGNKVNIAGDRGLIGLALDPGFASNGYVYLLYVYEGGGNPADNGPKTARLTRIQADPGNPDVALPHSEVVLLGMLSNAPCSQYAEGADCMASDSIAHTIGTVRFAPDGKMLVGMGDGASPFFLDPLAFRSQNLNHYNGKILRLNPDGSAPSDNPFYDGTNSIRSKVYAYGLRSPYRFGVHPTTGEVIIGDVGHTKWEELNRGVGKNFGWPCYEGNGAQLAFQNAFPAQCASVPASAVTAPLHTYSHNDAGAAVVGGPYYTATQFPPQYRGNYFFADYVQNFIRRVVFDGNNNVASIENFATNLTTLVSLELGPDGALYYVELETGHLRRIRFTGSVPTATATATRPSVSNPYTVAFSSAGSTDPNGGALTYLWEFGDGTTATAANPTHTYTATGIQIFTVKLTVTNPQGLTDSETIDVVVGGRSPVATIITPADGITVNIGATVTFTGTGTDPDETLPESALVWNVLLHHDAHVHPGLSVTGAGGSFVIENHGTEGTYFYEIILTVTDSSGLTNTKSIRVNPRSPISSLPAPWTAAEVGSNGFPGSANYASGTFTVQGSGTGIGGFSDGFYFVQQPLTGDGEIRARVVSVQNTAADAKAGVMIRAGTAANAAYAAMSLSPALGFRFERRLNTGWGTTVTTGGPATQPSWVRLVRAGNTFTSYRSANGISWTLVGTASIPQMPANTLIGLAVTSNNNAVLSTAVFDNVTVSNNTGDGSGLKGEYFDLSNLTVLRFTRIDSTINFDWDDGSPAPSLGQNDYAIRWTGQVKADFTEAYRFHTVTEGGVRLWVNGLLLINDWNDSGPRERSGTITLTAGQRYDLKLEYKETNGTAAIQLQWSSARQARQIIPQLRLYPPN